MRTTEIPAEISIDDFAKLIGVTPRTIRNYISEGIVTSGGRGKVKVAASIQGIVAAAKVARPDSQLDKARARALDARTRAQELRTAKEEAQLIPYDDAEELVDELIGLFVSHIESVPPRFTRDIKIRLELEKTVIDVRESFCDAVLKRREELRNEANHGK